MLFETRELFPLLLIRQMTASLAQICLSPSIYFDTHGFHQLLFASRQKETSGGNFTLKCPSSSVSCPRLGSPLSPPGWHSPGPYNGGTLFECSETIDYTQVYNIQAMINTMKKNRTRWRVYACCFLHEGGQMSLFRKMAFEQRHELSESMRYLGIKISR